MIGQAFMWEGRVASWRPSWHHLYWGFEENRCVDMNPVRLARYLKRSLRQSCT